MRVLLLALSASFLGCAPSPHHVVLPGGAISVAELASRHPIAETANIRADEIARTSGASVHLVQVRGGETPHRHLAHDLVVTVVQGEGELTVAGTRHALVAGDVAVVPRGTSHWFVRRGAGPATAIVTFIPPLDAPDNVPDPGVDSPAGAR